MEQIEALKARVRAAMDLGSLVRVMKTLAAVRVREFGRAVEALAEYNHTIEMGLRVVMKVRPREVVKARPTGKRVGAVVFGSEQGLCGRFNEVISEYAVSRMRELQVSREDRMVVVLGSWAARYLEEAGEIPEERFPFFEQHLGITQVILKVLTKMEDWELVRGVETVLLFYNRPEAGDSFAPHMQQLLPLDAEWLLELGRREWPGPTIPMFTMDWETLFSGLIRRHLFFSLYRALVESLASENASRMLAMEAAEKNIAERLDELKLRLNSLRQTSITSELLDVITSYEATVGGSGSSARGLW